MVGGLPVSLEQVLSQMKDGEFTVIAGGTDVMVRHAAYSGIRPKMPHPPVFIGHLNVIKGIERGGGRIHIGAATTLTEVTESKDIPTALKTVIADFASPAIRNSGTIGGNICNASPAGDTLPFFYVQDAEITLRSADTARTLPIREFITGPGITVRRQDELMVSVSWVDPDPVPEFLWKKIGQRKANALSKVSVYAEWSTMAGERLRFAVGGAAPTVVRLDDAERVARQAVTSGDATERVKHISQTLKLLSAGLSPIDDQRSTAYYRRESALRIVRRVLADLSKTGSE